MVRLQEYPYMTCPEVDILDKLLSELKPERCLEWGSGGSTLYFPKVHEKYIKKWLSLEHNIDWFNALEEKGYPKNVELIHLELVYKDFSEYTTYPTGKFNFILVDGRQRVACLQTIRDKKLLAKKGIVVLHDSGNLKYKPGFAFFDHYKELIESRRFIPKEGLVDGGLVKFWNDK